ncbi:hypothetical protein [Paraglaciecola chathamensis]|uniref:hypothetical protein n=1 Tax=Paraglaciecola chathamensis TaxID=368405 RepID=UPI003627F59D
MKKASIYQDDFKREIIFNFYVEKTPTTGDKFLDLVAFDGIEELFCNLAPYKGKVPIVIKEKGEAVSVVFVTSKEGDSYIKRQKESGKITTVKRVAIASPVYYIAKPKYIDNVFDNLRYTYKATADGQGNITSEIERILIWNSALKPAILVKALAATGVSRADAEYALGNCIAVAGRSVIWEAANTTFGNTIETTEEVNVRRNPDQTQVTEILYGDYEII